MRVGALLLCEAATVHDGLLNVLGGGINQVARPAFPAPLGVPLAVQLVLGPGELDDEFEIEVALEHDGKKTAGMSATFGAEPIAALEHEEMQIPIVFPTQGLILPRPGVYRLSVFVNGESLANLVLTARPPSSQER